MKHIVLFLISFVDAHLHILQLLSLKHKHVIKHRLLGLCSLAWEKPPILGFDNNY